MNSTAINVTHPNDPPLGNAYCDASVATISVCCKNSTNYRGFDDRNYCILNAPTGVRDCLKVFSDKFNGDAGISCTGNITEVQAEDQHHNDSSAAAFRGQRETWNKKKSLLLSGLAIMVVVGASGQF